MPTPTALAEHRRALRDGVRGAWWCRGRHAGRRVLRRLPDRDRCGRGGASRGRRCSHRARSRCGWACTRGAPTATAEGYVGIDVHRGARVGALAHGGQIIVSSTTAALVEDRAAAGSRAPPAQGLRRSRAAVPGRHRRVPAVADAGRRRPPDSRDPLPRPRARAVRGRDALARPRAARAHDRRPRRHRQDPLLDRARPVPRRGGRRRHGLRAARPRPRSRPCRAADRRSASAPPATPPPRSRRASASKRTHVVLDNLEQLLPDAAHGRSPSCWPRLPRFASSRRVASR